MCVPVHEGLKRLMVDCPKALELLDSNQADVTVTVGSSGSIVEVSLTPKNVVSSSDNSSTDLESLSPTGSDDEEVDSNDADESEDVDLWWKEAPPVPTEEEDDDLDFTLEWEDDNEAEAVDIPDVIEATQLPPGRMSGILSNSEPKKPVENEIVLPDSSVGLTDTKFQRVSSFEEEEDSWKECWNCRAPEPILGTYREGADCMRMVFCCDKPTRVKPTNTRITSNAKNFPYDSWIHYSC